MEDKRDDEVAEEGQDDKDQEQQEYGKGEDSDSVNMYVKSKIHLNDDDKRNPHETSSPQGNIALYWCPM